MKLTLYGKKEWLGGGLVALCLGTAGMLISPNWIGMLIALLSATTWLALAAFFRVPNRTIDPAPNTITAPADGVVKDIGIVSDHDIEIFEGQPLLRIGIFLSVFNVHVNRAPADFDVEYRKYKPGRFLDARNPLCAKENESLVIAGTAHIAGQALPMAVRQISGAVARRIVCEAQPGDRLNKGNIYGMIKFGSRTELYLPAGERIVQIVTEGAKVKSGSTIIARFEP
jgi:phosphatidylserine decarboxylase